MPFFSKVFRSKDNVGATLKAKRDAVPVEVGGPVAPPVPQWEDAWSRKHVAPEDVQELIHECTQEMKSRGVCARKILPEPWLGSSLIHIADLTFAAAMDTPFLLLPFRPGSDTPASKSFIKYFYRSKHNGSNDYCAAGLQRELRLTEPIVRTLHAQTLAQG